MVTGSPSAVRFIADRETTLVTYGAAAALNIFAIVGAWPAYGTPGFGFTALLVTLLGVPTSVWLRHQNAPRRTINLIVLGAALVAGLAVLSRSPLPITDPPRLLSYLFMRESAAASFLIQAFLWVAIFRAFTLLEDEDLPLTIIPAASTMILASILFRTVTSFLCFLGVVICAVILLALDQRRRQAARVRIAVLSPLMQADLLRRSLLLLLAVVLVAGPLGLLLANLGLVRELAWMANARMTDYVRRRVLESGVGSAVLPYPSVELGSRAASGSRVLFRVSAPSDQFWRSNCFDLYTGGGWQHSGAALRRRLLTPGLPNQYRRPATDAGPAAAPSSVAQTYQVATYFQGSLVGAYEPVQVTGPLLRPRGNDEAALSTSGFLHQGQIYQVVSLVKPPPMDHPPSAGPLLRPRDRQRYLQLPPLPARLQRLAQQVVAGAATPLRQAMALRSYLQDEMTYQQEVDRPPPDRDGTDWFVFQTKRGYCDYFTTALVVMCRAVGIPARFASGYVTGRVTADRWFEVRQQDAHSLAEVFLDGYGWMQLDATPPAEPERGLAGTVTAWISQHWRRARAALSAGLAAAAASPAFRRWVLVACALLLLALGGLRWARLERLPALPAAAGDHEQRRFIIAGYQAMTDWFARWGFPKPPGATAAEFTVSLRQALGSPANQAAAVVAAYQAARYGRRSPSAGAAAATAQALRALLRQKHAIRKALRAPLSPVAPG